MKKEYDISELIQEHERLIERLRSGKDLDKEADVQAKELKQLKRFMEKEQCGQ